MDISKCSNDDCVMKKECLRYTVQASHYYQSYTLFTPKENNAENFECNSFLKDERIHKDFRNR
jgi:hypothetical protein